MATVLVTRAPEDAAPLAAALQDAGWTPYVVPLTERVPVATPADRARVAAADAWIITSSAVIPWLPDAAPAWLACVGEETARRLGARGWRVDVVAPRARDLGVALAGRAGQRVCWPRAEEPTADARAAWAEAGLIVDEVAVYRNREPEEAGPAVRAIWPTDAVIFAAPSAARRLASYVDPRTPTRVIAIGPTTRVAAEAAGWLVFAEAAEPNVGGLVRALGPPPRG